MNALIPGFESTAGAIGGASSAIRGGWRSERSVGRVAAAFVLVLVVMAHAAAATAQIDAAATQQIIRGFGGATVFQPPGLPASLTSAELDALFGNAPNQIGLSLLRIRVAADDAWRAIELGHAIGALARGAQVIATPWSPPAAMKDNNNIVGGSLLTSAYADYAKYLNDFAAWMAANGAPLYAISVQNEPDISVTYESCNWTPTQMLTFCRNNAGAISATKVIMPESFQFRRQMSDPVLNDDTAAANIDIVGGHVYGGGLAPYPLAVSKGKEVWMTEYYDNQATDWAGALATGKNMHDCLTTASFSAYIWWYARRFYGPLGEDGIVTKRGWVMAQFSKFVRPGFYRVTATANPAIGVYVSVYKRDRLVIVAINQGSADATQAFSIANLSATLNAVTPWMTSAAVNLAAQPAIAVTNGSFTATLPASSVTTFVGDLVFPAPTIVTPPQSHNLVAGSTAVLDVATNAEYITYQWTKNGVPLRGATNRLLTLPNLGAADVGSYAVTLTNSGGTGTSAAATIGLSATGGLSRLTNISTRSQAQTGDNAQIAGFVIGGSAPKPVLVRAAGPVLKTLFGITGALDDPAIEVRDTRTGAVVASNDDWDPSLASTFASVNAFAWPQGSKDAAVLATLPPGGYTAVVRGRNGATGIALVEVYDTDGGSGLINISTRSVVGTGDSVQIGGFVLSGGAARTVVIRATGPTLHKSFSVSGALNDPVIELRSQGRSEVIATSDDWSSYLAPHFASVGAFAWPTDSRDAAIVATLEPGVYSVVVRDKNAATGVALIEVYVEP